MWTIDELEEYELPELSDIEPVTDEPECIECGAETSDGDDLCRDCQDAEETTEDEPAAEELPF